MGYYVTMSVDSLIIPKKNVENALKAINDLFEPELMKKSDRGWIDEHSTGKIRYDWVNPPAEGGFKTLVDALAEWRYEAINTADGGVIVECFTGEKLGDCDVLWTALAKFVNRKATITCKGEGGAIWRWEFKGGKFKEKSGTVSFA